MEKWKSADSSESQWILSLFLGSLWKFKYSLTLNKKQIFFTLIKVKVKVFIEVKLFF